MADVTRLPRVGPGRDGVTAIHARRDYSERRALCMCGWEGPWRKDHSDARADEGAHHDETGHLPLVLDAPASSPMGLLRRAGPQGTLGQNASAALERLRAVRELRGWLEEQEQHAVIGARMARATWTEIGEAWGTSRQGAFNRWGDRITRFEASGVLDAVAADSE
jgi:hypothetical protein